jgi:Dolichyl-phosphate-mannose-protein mannosyltransferase
MSIRVRDIAPLTLALLLALAAFLPGINWGLPSHAVDPFLFETQTVWPGAKIYALSGGWDAEAAIGADVARHPLGQGDQPILVNGDDVARARIMQRYRLYSDQPDEMITFRALSGIDARHGRFDPKLYQYGGLWMYGVGAMLEAAKLLGVITVRPDVAYYLDHPEAFGRFYVVARLYAAMGGLVLVAGVYGLMRQRGSTRVWASVAAAAVTLMPVVINAAHEAKPHLPGAALVLLAVWAGGEYRRRGTWRWLLATGALCGAATGMVLWATPIFLVVPMAMGNPATSSPSPGTPGEGRGGGYGDERAPALALPRSTRGGDKKRRRRFVLGVVAAMALGGAVYAMTNPYVVIHLLRDPAVLRSNLQNTSAMYGVRSTLGAGANALMLIIAGMSPLLACAGGAGAIALAVKARKRGRSAQRLSGILLATVAVALAIPYVTLAAGKPGEYGRFALVPDVALAMAAVMAMEAFGRRWAIAAVGLLLGVTAVFGARYVAGFVGDAGADSSRMIAAAALRAAPRDRLAIAAEPAPYCLPPVDLFRWKLLLLRRWDSAEADRIADGSCRAVDQPADGWWMWATPLSWAQKPFEISRN